MKLIKCSAIVAMMLGFGFGALAQGPGNSAKLTIGRELDQSVGNVEREFVPAAEALPEDHYSFAPSNGEFKGVRTFGEQVKHVAATNYMFGAAILGEKPPVEVGGENGPASLKSKAEIVKFLQDSFAYVRKAVLTIDAHNAATPIKSPFGGHDTTRLALATLTVGHCMDHYGQMVEYLRMNGIVPPASRR